MPDSPTSEPESAFVCDCEEWMSFPCIGEPFYKEHEGKRYCVLHFPGKEKSADFKKALQRKLDNKNFNFRGVWFPDELSFSSFGFVAKADFHSATFSAATDFSRATFSAGTNFRDATFSAGANFRSATFSAEADFRSATFSAKADFRDATFSAKADFSSATFSAKVDFRDATFSAGAKFRSATFSVEADFSDATFTAEADFVFASFNSEARFSSATFNSQADFRFTTFGANAGFYFATFKDDVKFAGNKNRPVFCGTSLSLQLARIEKPDHVSFYTLTLRPHWFVNVDARKFDFTNVDWDWRGIDEYIESLRITNSSSLHRLLAVACRHLAVNAEENHRYEEASKFRYLAMDARRREHWHGFAFWRLSWWYWLASGYGERVLQAFLMLLGILLLSALLYTQVGFARWEPRLASETDVASAKRDDVGAPLKFSRAMTYSAAIHAFAIWAQIES